MKKQFLRKLLLRTGAIALLFTSLFSLPASAQFNPPTAVENTYPTAPAIGLTGHTSAYSTDMANIPPYGNVTLSLAGWDDPNPAQPAGVSWQLLMVGNPAVIFAQGVIPYANVRDLEVGWLDVGGDPQVLVAYYQNGVGHMLDVYSMMTGTPVFLYTKVLSAMPNYTRISIDCHIPPYAVGIAWQDVGGINVCVGLNSSPTITYSNILTLTGTAGETGPDLAFVHTGTGLMLQTVYYNPVTGNITESMFDFWTALGTPGFTLAPTVNDVNLVGVCQQNNPPDNPNAPPAGPAGPKPPPVIRVCPYMNIDGPGHYSYDDWAYTYTTDNNNIKVRHMDQATSPFASTVIVNNGGPWFGLPINPALNINPFPFYNRISCGAVGIVVAWYTNYIDPMTGLQAGYVGLNMSENGTALLSAPWYLTVANNPTFASPTPVLSISKQDDGCQDMFTVFPELDNTGTFRMENKYPPQCVNSFKGEAQHQIECNDNDRIATFIKTHKASNGLVRVYPNPYSSNFKLDMPLAYQQDNMTVVVTDILGVTVGKFNGIGAKANAYLNELSKGLASGTYLLNINIPGKEKETLKITKLD